MALTFYYGSGSPYAWRVWLALEHKRLPYELKVLSFSAGDLTKPEFLALNPRHKVPVITDGDFSLYESPVIMEYLEERYPAAAPDTALWPKDIQARALARRLAREAEIYFGGAVTQIARQVFFRKEAEWDRESIAKGKEEALAELQFLERELRGDYLAGPLSAADFTLYPYLGIARRLESKKADLGLSAAHGPKLGAWAKRMEALPYFDKTYPPHWKQ
jgi:glutathione S-transferase